jgi:CRISPR/Cas system CSM-associated protein Csm3 (group 7 of RAMP superfamily)
MHKRLLNAAIVELTIEPDGPILVKAGDTGADPTRPDMEFVRTWRGGERVVYLPGPSLKGVLRAHCERIARSLDDKLACNPVAEPGSKGSCSNRLKDGKDMDGPEAHAGSCFICQMFGNTALAGHLRTADAYPLTLDEFEQRYPGKKQEWDGKQVSREDRRTQIAPRVEERNGVAIDRVFGSVAVGPFQLEVCTSGQFKTQVQIQNFTLAQLGLLALTLRDLKLGRVGVGFGKSRGLGRVTAHFDRLTVRYPACQVSNGELRLLNGERLCNTNEMAGADAFQVPEDYGYKSGARKIAPLPTSLGLAENDWLEPALEVTDEAQIENVWRACVPSWREVAIHDQ